MFTEVCALSLAHRGSVCAARLAVIRPAASATRAVLCLARRQLPHSPCTLARLVHAVCSLPLNKLRPAVNRPGPTAVVWSHQQLCRCFDPGTQVRIGGYERDGGSYEVSQLQNQAMQQFCGGEAVPQRETAQQR